MGQLEFNTLVDLIRENFGYPQGLRTKQKADKLFKKLSVNMELQPNNAQLDNDKVNLQDNEREPVFLDSVAYLSVKMALRKFLIKERKFDNKHIPFESEKDIETTKRVIYFTL